MSKNFAIVFPGQGSQSVGMLDAWGDHPEVVRTLAEASAALGEDIGALIKNGPKEQLDLTTNTQPVMLTAGIANYRAWIAETGRVPAAAAGHSLGEYTALVAAESGEVVEAVNFNDPKQTVIAGSKTGVEKANEALKAAGAKRALPLPVSAPFHSSLMKPAAERLREQLAAVSFQPAAFPVINNIDVAVTDDAQALRDALFRQAFGPVRWVEVVQALKARGLTTVIECGPGKVLAGMAKRIDAELVSATVLDPASLAEAKALLA